MKHLKILIFVFGIVATGCATIMGEKNQIIPISSSPSDAKIVISDEKGADVFQGQTPTTVTLQKSDGSYFGGKTYSVMISKEGYQSREVTVSHSVNGWYLAGNLVFGGLLGWLIVDPLSGKMYNLSPEAVNASLPQDTSFKMPDKEKMTDEKEISIVLLQDVPESLRSKMQALN